MSAFMRELSGCMAYAVDRGLNLVRELARKLGCVGSWAQASSLHTRCMRPYFQRSSLKRMALPLIEC